MSRRWARLSRSRESARAVPPTQQRHLVCLKSQCSPYEFAGWGWVCTAPNPTCVVVMDADKTVWADIQYSG
jgi:hypothetical protein